MKKFLIFCLALLMLSAGCSTEVAQVNVKIEIDCSDILQNYEKLDESLKDEKYVPSDGKILETIEVSAQEGDSALDVLKRAAKEHNIQLDTEQGYAKGINYIYEKSCGEMSGWIYEVNNEPIMTEYTVSEGDLISWIYICDFSQMSFE